MRENGNPPFDVPKRKKLIEAVFQKQFDKLCWFSCQLVTDKETAADITAEAFTKLLEGEPVLKEESERGVLRYLTASVRNLSINWLRDHRKYKQLSLDNELDGETATDTPFAELLVDPEESVEERFILQEQLEELHEAIKQLSPKQQECVREHYIKGLRHDEAASQMGITSDASRALGSRAVKKLKSIIERQRDCR